MFLGKEVLFQGQDNYVGLYRYLDDFVALYLTYIREGKSPDDKKKLCIFY
jgi:hypothetical protein